MDKGFITSHKKAITIISAALVAVIAVAIICALVFGFNSTHQVTFYDDNNVVLKVDKVKHGALAEPPSIPELTYGKIFKKWDTDFLKVEKDLKIRPEYEDVKEKANTFALSGAYCKTGESVMIPFMLCGDVKMSGFDAVIEYDPDKLTLAAVSNPDGDVVYNDTEAGKLRLNLVTTKNVESDIDICLLEMKLSENVEQADLKITVKSIYAVNDKGDLYAPEYNTVDSTVFAV